MLSANLGHVENSLHTLVNLVVRHAHYLPVMCPTLTECDVFHVTIHCTKKPGVVFSLYEELVYVYMQVFYTVIELTVYL